MSQKVMFCLLPVRQSLAVAVAVEVADVRGTSKTLTFRLRKSLAMTASPPIPITQMVALVARVWHVSIHMHVYGLT